MKNALSYELWRKAGKGQRDGRDRPHIKTKYVELVINGSYKGIYVFMDKPEKGNNNRMNIEGVEKDSEVIVKVESGAEHGIQSLFLGLDGRTKYEYYEPEYKESELTTGMKEAIKSMVHNAERSLLDCRLISD
jgi:CotH protein.